MSLKCESMMTLLMLESNFNHSIITVIFIQVGLSILVTNPNQCSSITTFIQNLSLLCNSGKIIRMGMALLTEHSGSYI